MIGGSYSSVDEDLNLLGFYTMATGKQLLTFQKGDVPSKHQ
jgi:hypothetical protein